MFVEELEIIVEIINLNFIKKGGINVEEELEEDFIETVGDENEVIEEKEEDVE